MAGHDVESVAEMVPGVEDIEVIRMATQGQRVLLTEDKDFGQLVYAHSQKSHGVMFLRYPSRARRQLAKDVVKLVKQRGQDLAGRFIVVQPGRIRIGRTP